MRTPKAIIFLVLLLKLNLIYSQVIPLTPKPAGNFSNTSSVGINNAQVYLLYQVDFDVTVKKITVYALMSRTYPTTPDYAHCKVIQSLNMALYTFEGKLLFKHYDTKWHLMDEFPRNADNSYTLSIDLDDTVFLPRGFYYIAFSTLAMETREDLPVEYCGATAGYKGYTSTLTLENSDITHQKNYFGYYSKTSTDFLPSLDVHQTDLPIYNATVGQVVQVGKLYTTTTRGGFPYIEFN